MIEKTLRFFFFLLSLLRLSYSYEVLHCYTGRRQKALFIQRRWRFWPDVRVSLLRPLYAGRGEMSGSSMGEFLSSATHEKSNSSKMNICAESERTRRNNYSASGVSEAFRWVGIVCFVLAMIIPLILLSSGSDAEFCFRRFHFPCACPIWAAGWIGVAHTISLLEQITENTSKKL